MVERLISKAPCDGSHLLHMTRSQDFYPRCFRPVDRSLLSENEMCVAHTPACSNIGAAVDRSTGRVSP
ncbi:hypothetical protein L596_029796 [Steinernema carpocapsae]|uniref:Uncharacterized protein n=1 Tax=Steinernema carpocapsae TaxID=34508 RepID=A0A4U5LQU6_STECR|nr:hypothetical protein L596_029796 [Steinernema carpocapsae]